MGDSARDRIFERMLSVYEREAGRTLPYLRRLLAQERAVEFLWDRIPEEHSRNLLVWYLSQRGAIEMLDGDPAVISRRHPGLHSQAKWEALMERAKAQMRKLGLRRLVDEEVVEARVLGGYTIDGVCMPGEGDVVFDLGVFNGNNSLVFSDLVGSSGRVYGFEPQPQNLEASLANCKGRDNIRIVNCGIGAEAGSAFIQRRSMASNLVAEETGDTVEIEVVTLDDFVEREALERVDFVKMDIEGFEVEALRGAQRLIHRHRPAFMIAAYHKAEDLFVIPQLIDRSGMWYRYYLRHYHWMPREMVLYAIPRTQAVPGWAAGRD